MIIAIIVSALACHFTAVLTDMRVCLLLVLALGSVASVIAHMILGIEILVT